MSYLKGFTTRRVRSGILVARVHYRADPERDSVWVEGEKRKYSSKAAWEREQEIVHDAGGGELVFAEILNRYGNKILITDPKFEVPPYWPLIAGFDHGKTNPTAVLLCAVDQDGVIYCLSEYYQPGLTPQQHVWNLRDLHGLQNAVIHADPSIFYKNNAQSDGDFKSIAELYYEAGLTNLCPAENAELAGMERILDHWCDLDYREPTLRIVCPEDHSRRQFGLFLNGCPNLLWEMMRTRRAQLTASQLMRRNPTEEIVDKDNHLRDCLKYVVLSRPAPAEVPTEIKRQQIINGSFEDGTYGTLGVRMAQLDEQERRASEPVSYVSRLPPVSDY